MSAVTEKELTMGRDKYVILERIARNNTHAGWDAFDVMLSLPMYFCPLADMSPDVKFSQSS